MRRLAAVGALVLVLSLACAQALSPIPPEVVEQTGQAMSALGHPGGEYVSTELSGVNYGTGSHDTYVDLDIRYDRKGVEHLMKVRIYVHELEPCRVTTDVLKDSGPPAILLDNALSSEAMGQAICDAMKEQEGG